MRFKTARFFQFRNMHQGALNLDQKDHFMLGSNGQGKSNCLEAIGFVSALRSFRTHSIKPLFLKKAVLNFICFMRSSKSI